MLTRKLLKRGVFTSLAILEAKNLRFVDFFNKYLGISFN